MTARAWEHRTADDDRLGCAQIRPESLEQVEQRTQLRIQIFVNRRADGNDDVFCLLEFVVVQP